MKVRKYNTADPSVMQLCSDRDFNGEFVHVNDIELFLTKEIQELEGQIKFLKINDDSRESDKQYAKELQAKVDLLNKVVKGLLR